MEKMTYVGMDVHKKWIVVVWKRREEKERVCTTENTLEGWTKVVEVLGEQNVWAAYEASSCGWGLHDWLRERGWKVSVLAPTHLPKSVKGRKTKTDERDARKILEILMAHGELGTTLPAVWVPSAKIREDREIVRRRLRLGERLTEAKNGITSLLRMHGLERPEELVTPWTRKHVAWLKGLSGGGSKLPGATKSVLASLVREWEFLVEEEGRLDEEVERLAKEAAYAKPVEKMTEISGVGELTALTFLLELGDPKRFSNRRQIGSYMGLVPSSHESGEATDRKGHITRLGPARIRKVLNQAAWVFLRCNAEAKQWYEKTKQRRGTKKAIVGVMRRLGIDLWRRAQTA
jgi:transposase